MSKTIHQFIHGKGSRRDQHVGVLLATNEEGIVVITGSKAKLSAGDKFDPKEGLRIATSRQHKVRDGRDNKVAASFKEDLARFESRCKRYFKDAIAFEIPALAKGKES